MPTKAPSKAGPAPAGPRANGPKTNGGPKQSGGAQPAAKSGFHVSKGVQHRPQRIVIYGTGGIGKSTLASLAPNPIFIPVEPGSDELDIARIDGIETWADLCSLLTSDDVFDAYQTIVLDSLTRCEELCREHVLTTITGPQGKRCTSIEDYGYGKGYTFLYEAMRHIFPLLDTHVCAGRNVIAICHETTARVPNPAGEDWIRYEPRLYHNDKGNSVRHLAKEWASHVLFLGYDVFAEDGKASGSGTRTIYVQELPTHIAKSRKLRDPVEFTDETDDTIWQQLFAKGGE